MSDDIGTILESAYAMQRTLLARVESLERQVSDLGASPVPVPGNWGYCSPCSPPSKYLQIRRGTAISYDHDVTIVTSWPDMTPALSTSAFTNDYYYRAVVPCLNINFQMYDMFFIWESPDEYETYDECAAAFMRDIQNWNVIPQDASDGDGAPIVPLCALALRTYSAGYANRYEFITLNDRTLSSFIVRDLRPWLQAVYTYRL